jgi:valyl-tRNA synthetase
MAESRIGCAGANVVREPRRVRPIARKESAGSTRPRDDRGTADTEPAGGTTTPFVRWTIGAVLFPEETVATDVAPDKPHTSTNNTTKAPRTGEMPPAYRAADVERRIYEQWLEADVFAPDGKGSRADWSRKPFVITQPPPNITGGLHVGHALTATLEDAMIRRARMQGYPTLWVPGVDHASISAQIVLDRIIAKDGESRASLGRERYLERMWEFINATRSMIGEQHKRLGASVDWNRLRFTMDEGSAHAVRVAFKRLYDDGLAYRAEQLINWCPGCRTSVSDLEVIATPTKGTLWKVRYHFVRDDGSIDPDDSITVATTRPETILGDTAVAVHPEDERYAAVVGRNVMVPFVERVVPIIADDVVRRDFGTGAVKITPAHDQDDFETGKRHELAVIDVMTDDGRINERGGAYSGLKNEDARKRILEDLDARGDLVASDAHDMVVGRCERSNDVIEPRIKTQWFINVKPMADKAMASVRDGRTEFVPKRYRATFFGWMENIHDWNVSRQLWWGHRIPAWYCPDGHVTVSDSIDGPNACDVCGRAAAELRQETDIFDTWFSSGLWPWSTLGWPDETADFKTYYPTSVMETGYDIIFFWVSRMMMLGEWLTGLPPFHTVYLHGIVRDPYGAKMSKTKGNVLDPLEVIDELGADALRFALVNGPEPSQDQKMSRPRLEEGRNFANKLWNAARFVLSARPAELARGEALAPPAAADLGAADEWILARCAATLEAVDAAYAQYEFGRVAHLLYEAIWSEYCDWYLEMAKASLAADAPAARRRATWQTLSWVLDRYLRLLHPLMPHVTEEIWSRLPHLEDDPSLLIVAPWPSQHGVRVDADPSSSRASGVAALIELISGIRAARAEAGIQPADFVDATVWLPEGPGRTAFGDLKPVVERLARIRAASVDERAALDEASGDALTVVTQFGEARLMRSNADAALDRARLEKELRNSEAALEAANKRLEDPNFIGRAPAAVVEQAQRRAAELRDQIAALRSRVNREAN